MRYYPNTIFKYIYYLEIAIPLLYLVIATYSYFSVYVTFGQVPYNDTLYQLARESGHTIKVFPIKSGGYILVAMVLTYFATPFLILINGLFHIRNAQIKFNAVLAMILFFICILSIILLSTPQFGGWYLGFIFD